jgi:hypothetical protein
MPSLGVLPPAFPSSFPSNRKSLRFYETGENTADFSDRSFSFERPDPKDPAEPEQAWASHVRIRSIDTAIEWSFDGVTVHGEVPANDSELFWGMYEGGIAVRGTGAGVSTGVVSEDPGTTSGSTVTPTEDGVETTFAIQFAHIPIDVAVITVNWEVAAVPKTATILGTSTLGGADAAEIVSALVDRATGQLAIEFVNPPDTDTIRLSYDYLYYGVFHIEAW